MPQPQGMTSETNDTLTPFAPHHDIGTCLNQYL
jgi:hypothetical protein